MGWDVRAVGGARLGTIEQRSEDAFVARFFHTLTRAFIAVGLVIMLAACAGKEAKTVVVTKTVVQVPPSCLAAIGAAERLFTLEQLSTSLKRDLRHSFHELADACRSGATPGERPDEKPTQDFPDFSAAAR
jgi:hypothetical protein